MRCLLYVICYVLPVQSVCPRRCWCAASGGRVYQGLEKNPEKDFILLILGLIITSGRVLWFWYIVNNVKVFLMGGDYESSGGRQLHCVRVVC